MPGRSLARALVRRALLTSSALLAVPATGCFVDVSLDGKRCGDGHDCVAGYVCVDEVCVEGTKAPPLADAGARDAGDLDAGHVDRDAGSREDAGELEDAGEREDAGELDGGDDAGAIDAGDDAGLDAGADAGHDAGSDAGADAGTGEEPVFGSGRDGPLDVSTSTPLNTCRPLLSSDAVGVTLTTASGIEPGTAVMLWQVQDTFATLADGSLVGSAGAAGISELVRVIARQGDRLITDPPPAIAFHSDDGSRAQACTVPEHTTVVIRDGGALVAEPWNGSTGGVVALFASTSIVIEAGGRVDANVRGFRGGLTDPGTNDADHITAETTNREEGGQKGEGLDPTAVGLYGRGNYANGGGGGNAHNGGGGGGGNGGRGGIGGIEWEGDSEPPSPDTGGRPGASVHPALLSLGGGGGAGEVHHTAGADGGRGGGVVLLLTPSLAGGGVIRANGASTPGIGEAGSGGGAGGTVWLMVLDVSGFSGSVEARGGRGGDADSGLGPGGGGGGGVVRATAAVPVDVSGGASGVTEDGPRGAEPGDDGVFEVLSGT